MSSGLTAVGVAGGVLLLVTLTDIFVAVFNYDGFTFLTARIHRMAWCGLRGLASLLPAAIRDTGLSVASAAMLPATLAGWLALEITAFAMMYLPGMAGGSFRLRNHLPGQIGTAYYFSAGDITSLTFGDVVAGNGIYRALTDEYTTTVRRLQRSFVGPPDDLTPAPLPEAAFSEQYRRAGPQTRWWLRSGPWGMRRARRPGWTTGGAHRRRGPTNGTGNGCRSTAAGASSSTG